VAIDSTGALPSALANLRFTAGSSVPEAKLCTLISLANVLLVKRLMKLK